MKIFTFCVILFPSLIFSQIAFDEEKILIDDSHYNAEVIATAIEDMDNDGDKDVIAASRYDSQVLMYENVNGDLLHNPRILITSNSEYPRDLDISDVDNDGLKDIIVTSQSGNKIIWFKNLGANAFSEETVLIDNFTLPNKIIFGDLDNDGDNDFVVTSIDNGNIYLFKNNGSGNFPAYEILFTTSYDGERVYMQDLNNDGLLDIIAGDYSGEYSWILNLGNGMFGPEQILGYGDDIEFYDINNDTYLDAIGTDEYDNEVYYYLNQGGNSFGSRISISTAHEDPLELEMADMDNDGTSDIVVVFSNDIYNGSIGWFKNNGNETFSSLNIITTELKFPRVLRTADIDADGKQDLLFRDENLYYKFSWYKNIDGYNFEENVINFELGGVRRVRVADLNNDGKKDIIAGQHKITWFENYGNNTFSAPRLISNSDPVELPFTYDIEIRDIDGDTDLDIISLIHTQIDIYENLGNGQFTLQSSIFFSHPSEHSREIEIGDLDGDGFFDIATTLNYSNVGNKMGWFKNMGDNTFAPFIPLNFAGQYDFLPYDLKIGDIDNDGDNDIVTSSPEYARTNFLKNDGAGNFTLTTTSQFVATEKIVLEDLENDGDLDIITSGYWEWGIYIQKNTNGFYGGAIPIDEFQIADDIFFEDINNDGLKDIIGTAAHYNPNENLVFYYLNNGSSFGQKTIINSKDSEFSSRKNLYVADINNDNKNDVLVGQSWEDLRLSYYSNESILGVEDNQLVMDKENIFYPNPVTNIINWNIHNSNNFYDIDILNSQGSLIFSAKDYGGSSISLSFLSSGIYFIRLSSNSHSIVSKIIKK